MPQPSRTARQRRIVRAGNQLARLLDEMQTDLADEIPDLHRAEPRGADKAADHIGDVSRAFDSAAHFARFYASDARRRLEEAGAPLSFPREAPTEKIATTEEPQPARLWDEFIANDSDDDETLKEL